MQQVKRKSYCANREKLCCKSKSTYIVCTNTSLTRLKLFIPKLSVSQQFLLRRNNTIDRQTIIRRGRGAGKEVILTWSAALFFVASCSVEQWCATNGACYAVHAWNAPRYIVVRSHVPRAVHRVQSRGLLREPRKFKASQEFCVVTIRLGGAVVPREPRLEKPWRACSCKRRVSFGRRPFTADNDRWNDLISHCDDYFCLKLCWRYERLDSKRCVEIGR